MSISDHIVRFLLYFSNIRLYFESKLIGPVQLKIRQTENQVDPDFPAHLSDVDNDFFLACALNPMMIIRGLLADYNKLKICKSRACHPRE